MLVKITGFWNSVVHRSAIYLSEKYPSINYWIFLICFLGGGISSILLCIYHIYYSIPNDDSKLLEEFMNKRTKA
jgi:hypothetical protein